MHLADLFEQTSDTGSHRPSGLRKFEPPGRDELRDTPFEGDPLEDLWELS